MGSKSILYCKKCKIYTLKENCPKCGNPTVRKVPPPFKWRKYARYRRILKREMLEG